MNYISRFCLFIMFFMFINSMVHGEIITKTVEYKHGDVILEGYLAYDNSIKEKTPAVLIVHEWTGLGPYVKGRAEQIAKLGYAAFAIDIYGKGIRPETPAEAGKQASIYRNDRELMRRRAHAGLEEARKLSFVSQDKIAAIGYCFGGTVVLEMARAGEDLAGVISFHGNLDSPTAKEPKNIKAKILVLHGADDQNISHGELTDFENEMRLSKADWQVVLFGNAVHSFTNPASGNDLSKSAAYNEKADKRSWKAMKIFFQEIFTDLKNTQTTTKNIKALALLSDAKGKDVGTVSFEQIGQEVLVKVNLHNMPEGIHGFHIHERGLCEAPDFASGGGHFNPFHEEHGLKNPKGPHAGDLPNISINSDGTCVTKFSTRFISLEPDAMNSVFKEGGTAVIIHERPDDYISDPTGNAGARIACGVIEKM